MKKERKQYGKGKVTKEPAESRAGKVQNITPVATIRQQDREKKKKESLEKKERLHFLLPRSVLTRPIEEITVNNMCNDAEEKAVQRKIIMSARKIEEAQKKKKYNPYPTPVASAYPQDAEKDSSIQPSPRNTKKSVESLLKNLDTFDAPLLKKDEHKVPGESKGKKRKGSSLPHSTTPTELDQVLSKVFSPEAKKRADEIREAKRRKQERSVKSEDPIASTSGMPQGISGLPVLLSHKTQKEIRDAEKAGDTAQQSPEVRIGMVFPQRPAGKGRPARTTPKKLEQHAAEQGRKAPARLSYASIKDRIGAIANQTPAMQVARSGNTRLMQRPGGTSYITHSPLANDLEIRKTQLTSKGDPKLQREMRVIDRRVAMNERAKGYKIPSTRKGEFRRIARDKSQKEAKDKGYNIGRG